MLHPVKWKFGLHAMNSAWSVTTQIEQDAEGVIWLRFLDLDAAIGKGDERIPVCIPTESPGVYETTANFEHWLTPISCDVRVIDKYGEWTQQWYGVADNLDQILAYFAAEIADPDRRFVIGMAEVRKEHQGMYGWRWHKWGPYIGTHQIRHEYLADEQGIERVWCFHLYEVEVVA